MRAALRMVPDGVDDLDVVGEAADGDEVAAAVEAHAPDVVLMDLPASTAPRRPSGSVAAPRRRWSSC